jgi:hypothetical protein
MISAFEVSCENPARCPPSKATDNREKSFTGHDMKYFCLLAYLWNAVDIVLVSSYLLLNHSWFMQHHRLLFQLSSRTQLITQVLR